MAKVILGFAAALILVAAGLAFHTKGLVEAKVADLKKTKTTLAKTQGDLKKTEEDLKGEQTAHIATKATLEETTTKLTSTETMLTAAKADLEKATKDLEEKVTLIAAKDKEINDLKNPTTPEKVMENPALKEAQDKITKLTSDVAEAKLAAEQYQARQKAAEEKVAGLQATIDHYRKGVTQAGLTGTVLNVNAGWNFVVIDLGDKQGVTVNSPLIVLRGGQRVATLKVTSVEPRQSIADVVPGTMARGTFVQIGDRVVFAGTRGQGATPPPPGPNGEAPLPAPGTPVTPP